MKKTIYTLAILAFATISFSSCKKCIECTITDENSTQIGTSGEVCGNSDEIDDIKAVWEANNATYKAAGLDYTLKCEDK